MTTTEATTQSTAGDDTGVLDAVILGAGVSGIDQLHKLRERGLNALVVDAAGGVGGTWYWNRYPGARLDSESYSYGYFFSDEILNEWKWSEHFCSQPENEAYFNFTVDKLGLRPYIRLNTLVLSATFDPDQDEWKIVTSDGDILRARLFITGIGILSDPQYPNVPGREDFKGAWAHTARYPAEGIDMKGKRVAVVGTGSSGVQIITAIGPEVGSLTVFQRTANWCTPLNNGPISDEEMEEIRTHYDEIYQSTQNPGGFVHNPIEGSAFDVTPEERLERYEMLYKQRGFAKSIGNYPELLLSKEINAEFSAFLEAKIRARINDQSVADKLIPTDHGYGLKRPPYESGYFEIYNQPNVELVDMREEPMVQITETGIKTTKKDYEFDVIIYATGFDAITGAFNKVDIVGARGETLKEHWANGPLTYVGLASHGFPNLLFVGGPQALGGNNPRAIEKQTDWVADLAVHLKNSGITRIEATESACIEWTDHVNELAAGTLYEEGDSWMYGSNTAGKARAFGLYIGGMMVYADKLSSIAKDGYAGFELS
jgi:cation diffusion facilitator CzcD-associated flavoprotein CzcO